MLDSTCSRTVCGENWLNSYIQSLDREDKMKVQHSIGERVFDGLITHWVGQFGVRGLL